MPLQYSLLILRYCVPTTLGHILRTIPPVFTKPYAEELDRRICSLVSERALLPSPLPPVAQSLFHLPGRFGGVGIPSAALTLSATYWGAFALAVPILRLHRIPRLPADLCVHLQATREGLLQGGVDGLPPAEDLLEAYARPPRQKVFTSTLLSGLYETTLDRLPASGKAWLRSAQLEGAKSTLWTLIPHRPDFRLSDFEVATSLAQWMTLPPPGFTAEAVRRVPCSGCKERLAPERALDHLHSCRALRRRAVTLRHDLLTSRLATMLQCVNAVTRVEPRSFSQSSRSRPDLAIHWPTSSPHLSPFQLLDISYVHLPPPPTALAARLLPSGTERPRSPPSTRPWQQLKALHSSPLWWRHREDSVRRRWPT